MTTRVKKLTFLKKGFGGNDSLTTPAVCFDELTPSPEKRLNKKGLARV